MKEKLNKLYKYWMKFGRTIGIINTKLVLALLFYTVFTLYSIILKIFNKDLLDLKFDKSNSYWKKRENRPLNKEDYLKQY